MIITIWSDIRCPFCYIGKRKLENALLKFSYKEEVTIEWKSFELDPNMMTNPNINVLDYYVHKGADKQQMEQLFDNAKKMGKEVGLTFNFNKMIVANSFKAHKLMHLSKEVNKQNTVKEMLFEAYFTNGENIDDDSVIENIGLSLGFDSKELQNMLESEDLDNKVAQDQIYAKEIGVTGVPFFLIDNETAISGVQSEEMFLETLYKTHQKKQK
ncbi:MAG: DsbA family oxidoreductase [Cellulophaga sp.]